MRWYDSWDLLKIFQKNKQLKNMYTIQQNINCNSWSKLMSIESLLSCTLYIFMCLENSKIKSLKRQGWIWCLALYAYQKLIQAGWRVELLWLTRWGGGCWSPSVTDPSPLLLKRVCGRSDMLHVSMFVQGPVWHHPMPHVPSLSCLWKPLPLQPDGRSATLVFSIHITGPSLSQASLSTLTQRVPFSAKSTAYCYTMLCQHCMPLQVILHRASLSSLLWCKYLHPYHPLSISVSLYSLPLWQWNHSLPYP